jgi:hypothetical protein
VYDFALHSLHPLNQRASHFRRRSIIATTGCTKMTCDTMAISLHCTTCESWALQDNCVLQVYSAVCNTIPRTVVWQEGENGLPLVHSWPGRGQLGDAETALQARHGVSTNSGIGMAETQKASSLVGEDRGRKHGCGGGASKEDDSAPSASNRRVLSLERTSVPGDGSTLLTVKIGDFCGRTFQSDE